MITIAHITDLHILADGDQESRIRNEHRLRTVLEAIHQLRPWPAAIIATGDLVDRGEPAEYAALAAILSAVEIPIYLAMGNHDQRAPLLKTFAEPWTQVDASGFVQYAVDIGDLRLVVCDTVEEGVADGAFCEARAEWLAHTLDAAPLAPTIVVLHHPPIVSGIQWMDPAPDADWIARVSGVLTGRKQVLAVICGHVHRPFHGMFAGHAVSVSAATALQLTLDVTPIDPRMADGRQILLGEPPGFSLLFWDGEQLTIHNCVAGDFPDQITYNEPFQKP